MNLATEKGGSVRQVLFPCKRNVYGLLHRSAFWRGALANEVSRPRKPHYTAFIAALKRCSTQNQNQLSIQNQNQRRSGLNNHRTALADTRGLLEGVCQLQDSPVVMVAADDLNSNGKAARRKCAGH